MTLVKLSWTIHWARLMCHLSNFYLLMRTLNWYQSRMLIDIKVCIIYIVVWCRFVHYFVDISIPIPPIHMYLVPVMTTIVLYDRTVSSEYDKAHTRELHQLARSQDPDLLRWPLIGGELVTWPVCSPLIGGELVTWPVCSPLIGGKLVTWPVCSPLIGAQVPAGQQEEEHQDWLRLRAAAGPAGGGAHQVQGVSLVSSMDQIQGVSSEPPATPLTTAAVPRDVGLVLRQLGWGGGWAASRVTPILR